MPVTKGTNSKATPQIPKPHPRRPGRKLSIRQLLKDPPILHGSVMLYIDEASNIYAVTVEEHRLRAAELIAQGPDAVRAFEKAAKKTMGKLQALVGSWPRTLAFIQLFNWALLRGRISYHELIDPRYQLDLLDEFCQDVLLGLNRLALRKQQNEDYNRAFECAEPILIRYRKAAGISLDARIPNRAVWRAYEEIFKTAVWRKLQKNARRRAVKGIPSTEKERRKIAADKEWKGQRARLQAAIRLRWSTKYRRKQESGNEV